MEVRSEADSCLDYDVEAGRLFLDRAGERHEIQVRPQVHALVRHIAARNRESGDVPVLCSHEELLHAVWGDEPLHTNTELAKLFWELRRQLEPLDAGDVVVNERGRGYRLVTCASTETSTETGTAGAKAVPKTRARPTLAIAGVVLLAVAGGILLAVLLVRGESGGGSASSTETVTMDAFVNRIENLLEQSAAGRVEIGAALRDGLSCRITPDEAARRVSSVADNRQSILDQLGSLRAPTPEADSAITLLQRALQQSIEADRHYRDGFLEVQAGARCPLPTNPGFVLAMRSDRRATAAKKDFIARFNPLARGVGARDWTLTEF
jgi:DNA-binding winged helix-turn-helix (wHTH) protein